MVGQMTSSAALKAIHAKRRQMGLDEDSYRALLSAVTGKSSSAEMNELERRAVLSEMDRRGAPKAPARRTRASGPYAGKLQALWIAAWNLGCVRDSSDAAMLAFVRRQTGLEHSRFLRDPADASRAIEALKDWMRRESGVATLFRYDRSNGPLINDDRCQILLAQWARLLRLDAAPAASLEAWVSRLHAGAGLADLTRDGWIDTMNILGSRLRKALAARKAT
jgi:phage gp16-like protein